MQTHMRNDLMEGPIVKKLTAAVGDFAMQWFEG